jgi:hypothetical protein
VNDEGEFNVCTSNLVPFDASIPHPPKLKLTVYNPDVLCPITGFGNTEQNEPANFLTNKH